MKKLLALILAVCMLGCFAGCGSTDTSSNADTEKKGTIVVGYTLYEPMNYLDDNGELVGLIPSLQRRFLKI